MLKAICLSALFTTLAVCQDATGRVAGTVTDPSGAVISGAKVTVTNAATDVSRETTTGTDGAYQVLQVPIGDYRVAAEAPGFRRTVTSDSPLRINETLHIDVKLEVGATTETIQVEALAAGVETVNSTLGSSVTSRPIVEMPLNGRNVLDLALLQPGVVPASDAAGGAGNFNIAGGRQDSVAFLLDGGTNNNLLNNGVVYNPNPDSVQEFRILTSNYNAEFGRNAGGVVSVVTKTGSNHFHGTAYDFIRNDAFNANSFFNNAGGLPKEILKRNQFGGTLGGPVILPKIVNGHDKFFFFVSYQGQRQTALQTGAKTQTYTPAELNGDFSQTNSGAPDPGVVQYLQQFPYFQPNPALAAQGIIDPSRIDPVAQNYIKANLVPTSASGFLIPQSGATDDNNELTGKVDYHITQKDVLTVTLGGRRGSILNPFSFATVSGYPITTSTNNYFGNVAYTRTITPNIINEFRFTAQRNNNLQSVPGSKLPNNSELGIGTTPDNPTGPPNISLASGLAIGFSVQGPTNLIDNTYTWSDVFTWVKGKHALKQGFWYTPYQNNTIYDFYVNGNFFFSGATGNGGIGSGNDRADFLLGLPDEYLQFGAAPSNIRSHNLGFFWQDEWRVSPKLTLTLGIRYEYSSPKLDLQSRSFSLLMGQQSTVFPNAPLGLLFPGDANAPRGSNFPDKNDWAPRFGFAYAPTPKTSVRGGFGVFYDVLKAEDNLQYNGQAPFFGFADLFPNPLDPANPPSAALNYLSDPFGATGQPNPFPSKPPAKNLDFDAAGFLPFGGGGVYFVDPHLRTPYIYQYNLSLQRELTHNLVAEVSYVGSDSHKLTGLYDSNPFILGTTTRIYNTQPGVPSYGFSYLDTFANVGSAHFNSMQSSLTKRPGETKYLGTTYFTLAWTYGRSIDNVSGFRTNTGRVPYYNWNQFRADSDFDLRHYVVFSGGWDLPFDRAWSSGPRLLTTGWSLSPIITYRTGQPLDIRANISRARTRPGPSAAGDASLVRVNLVSPPVYYDPHTAQTLSGNTGNFWMDPASFSSDAFFADGFDPVNNPSQRTYGSLGRNALRGPGRANVDLSIAKNTKITERMAFQIRADFFNLLNHTEFGNPDTTFTDGTFGQISTTAAPRIIQLAGRLTF
jgi:hypothetical protein